jgi:hypothetical protein
VHSYWYAVPEPLLFAGTEIWKPAAALASASGVSGGVVSAGSKIVHGLSDSLTVATTAAPLGLLIVMAPVTFQLLSVRVPSPIETFQSKLSPRLAESCEADEVNESAP